MTLTPNLPATTERLTLRFSEPTDAEAMLTYKSQPDVVRYVPYPPLSLAEITERLGAGGRWSRRTLSAQGEAITIAVVETATGRLVGDVVLIWASELDRVIEIGYILAPEFTGRGYATEAASALLALAFNELNAHRVVASVDPRNVPSIAVLERLRMRREALHVSNHWIKGEWMSTLIYAITEAEWFGRADDTSLGVALIPET